jgi:hypothetical protein
MVTRRYLTKTIVDEAALPNKGEVWIADTGTKGLGLRLWASSRGGGKAFALRVSDKAGKSVRLAYDHTKSWQYGFYGYEQTLGDFVDEARNWARDEIRQIKGYPSPKQLSRVQHRRIRTKIRKITLARAAEHVLYGMRLRGLSESYIDRLDKLFDRLSLLRFGWLRFLVYSQIGWLRCSRMPI